MIPPFVPFRIQKLRKGRKFRKRAAAELLKAAFRAGQVCGYDEAASQELPEETEGPTDHNGEKDRPEQRL